MPGPVQPKAPSTAMGSFGYMQNPVMNGAGMHRALPQQAQGGNYPTLPMFQPQAQTVK